MTDENKTALAPFPEREFPITLSGAEWFAIVSKLSGHSLSSKGQAELVAAGKKMAAQLQTESDRK